MLPGEADYRRKIKTREALAELIGPRPRARSVIMCHGTFDLVHPGHIRHLMYAKTKAAVVVASLTCDAHITKGHFRPYVPQELRAMNLAALEVVDYVVIDENPTPIENVKFLQPDYFAKGYEYVTEGLRPATREEIEALESYGGEIIFTPGDIVFSSSAFIDKSPPRMAAEKLLTLMESEGVTFGDLREGLGAMAGVRAHVVGDTIVDSHTYCTLVGGGTKTPTLSVKQERRVDWPGGAAVVAKHAREAGCIVTFTTVLGNDALGSFVLDDLRDAGIECRAVIDPTRPTTQKTVFIAGGYRMLKVDTLDNRPVSGRILEQVKRSVAGERADVLIFSDFRHGVFSRGTIPELIGCVPDGALRVADSQVASRWGNILDFRGYDLITPNEREARFALGDQDSVVRPLAQRLYREAQCRTLILKLGDRGIITYRSPGDDVRAFFTIDSFVEEVRDPVGAGDALTAYAGLVLAATGSPVLASILGSMAAAVACEHEGNGAVTVDQVRRKLQAAEKQLGYR